MNCILTKAISLYYLHYSSRLYMNVYVSMSRFVSTALHYLYISIFFFFFNKIVEMLGALSWSISMLISPFVVTFCRKKSTRLLAVVGGLVLPLGMLFTSFATELGQIIFSYGK